MQLPSEDEPRDKQRLTRLLDGGTLHVVGARTGYCLHTRVTKSTKHAKTQSLIMHILNNILRVAALALLILVVVSIARQHYLRHAALKANHAYEVGFNLGIRSGIQAKAMYPSINSIPELTAHAVKLSDLSTSEKRMGLGSDDTPNQKKGK